MPFRRIRMPRSSRASSPRVAIDVARSIRLTLTVAVALSAAAAACAFFALTTDVGWAFAAAAALALALRPTALLFGLSPDSIRRFEWCPDGAWHIQKRSGEWRTVRLSYGSTVLGPLVLLVWRDGTWRRYALLDAAAVDPRAFRRLRGRLRLEVRRMHRPVDNYC